ncbi:MAG: SpoIIAA family protein [Planctomycetota bacterium]|jgi:hypothetical protein
MSIQYSDVELSSDVPSNIVSMHISGRITAEDYSFFVPELESLIRQHGKVRLLLDMEDFHGWTAGALWEYVKFDPKHLRGIERLAMIGDTAWEKGMEAFCRPFTSAKIRYFGREQSEEARAWIADR